MNKGIYEASLEQTEAKTSVEFMIDMVDNYAFDLGYMDAKFFLLEDIKTSKDATPEEIRAMLQRLLEMITQNELALDETYDLLFIVIDYYHIILNT